MIRLVNVKEKSGHHTFTSEQKFGGFIAYGKLTIQIYQMIWSNFKYLSTKEKAKSFFPILFELFYKTIWWLFLKPNASYLLKTKTIYKCEYLFRFYDNKLQKMVFKKDSKKTTLYFLCLIPFSWKNKFNEKDKNFMFEKIMD